MGLQMRVIIVEDHPMIRDILVMALRNGTDYQVDAFGNAHDGIAACLAGADLAIFDHHLPDSTGAEAASVLRADVRTAHLPIIVVTGEHDLETRMTAISAGATDFLTKPVDIEELRLRVRNLLSLHQARKTARDRGDLLETLISGSDAAIAVADARSADRRFLYVSKALRQLWNDAGVTQAQTAYELPCGDEGQTSEKESFSTALKTCAAGRLEVRLGQDHRSGHWHAITTQPVPDSGEGARFLVISYQNISSVVEMRADLSRVEGRLTDIARVSGAWFFEFDDQLRLSYVSEGMAHAFSVTPDDILGRHIDQLGIRLKDTNARGASISAVLQDSGNRRLNELLSFKLPDGSLQALQVSMFPFHDSSGVFCGFRGYAGDVSALAEARDQAQQASRAKSAFLATMSHEMRTPLTAILGMTELLSQSAGLVDENAETLAQISTAATELAQALGDVLDVARMENGPIRLNAAPFDIGAACRQALQSHRCDARSKGLAFSARIVGDDAPLRMGDAESIRQMLRHILSNAVKFTEVGSISVEIDLSASASVTIRVSDTGIGMTPEQMRRAFEPFQQIDDSMSRRFGGQGVGLSIARWLAQSMQGALSLDSHQGLGTVVTLNLPLAMVDAEPPSTTRKDLEGCRVLVADDSAANRRMLDMMLQRMHARVILCDDGESALQEWARHDFDLLLLDINMPRMAGTDLIREIRKREANIKARPVPALAVTANAMPGQVRDYLDAGFDGCLGKPFSSGKLQQTISQFV